MPDAPSRDPIIATRELRKDFGSVQALGPISVSIPRGAWGLLGPNGAGKTTFIRLILGLTRPTSGEAVVLGLDAERASREVRQRTGFAPERDSYVPGLSGFRFVAYAGRLCGLPTADAKSRAHEALNFVGIDEARYRDVASYSQGMRQRVKLAQAIVHDPELVLLDEPTAGLDPAGREEMLALIRSLARDHGMSLLLATHIMPEVEAVCRGALVLDRGRAVVNATLDELGEVRRSTYIVRVRGDARAFASALQGLGADVEQMPDGHLVVRLPANERPSSILVTARATGVQVRHLVPARATLEDAFMTVLEREGGAR